MLKYLSMNYILFYWVAILVTYITYPLISRKFKTPQAWQREREENALITSILVLNTMCTKSVFAYWVTTLVAYFTYPPILVNRERITKTIKKRQNKYIVFM